MVKVVYGALVALAVAALVAAPGCRGKGDKEDEGGEGCYAGCAEGCAEGCAGWAEGCGEACAACGEACAEGCAEGCTGCAEGCAACGEGCGAGAAAVVSAADARQATRLAEAYVRWTRMHKEPQLSRQHGGHMVVSFTDKRAKETYRSGEGAYETYSALAKEGWKDGERKLVWLMQKRKPGYDPENGNWWYATVAADGTVMNAGKVAACIACHTGADNDYVYGH
jgi:hypothetical protein